MTGQLCPHGDIAAACLECLDGPPPERPAPKVTWRRTGSTIVAQHPGICEGCDGSIEPAADPVIRLWERHVDGKLQRNAWLHDGCEP